MKSGGVLAVAAPFLLLREALAAEDGAEAAELGGGGSLLPPITTVMSPLTATGPAVTEQWSVPLLVPVKPVLGDEY